MNISKFLSVEFSRFSNSQIYIENSPKDVFYFLLFFPEESADCKTGVVPSRKCKQNGNSFQRKNADVWRIALFYKLSFLIRRWILYFVM